MIPPSKPCALTVIIVSYTRRTRLATAPVPDSFGGVSNAVLYPATCFEPAAARGVHRGLRAQRRQGGDLLASASRLYSHIPRHPPCAERADREGAARPDF